VPDLIAVVIVVLSFGDASLEADSHRLLTDTLTVGCVNRGVPAVKAGDA